MDETKLRADVQALYEGIAAYEGLPHSERVLDLVQRLMMDYPTQPQAIIPACLLHSIAPLEATARGATSAIIAGAYLRGLGEGDNLTQRICGAIRETDRSGVGEDGQPMSDEGLLLWHADQLDTLSVERHVDFLAETPLPKQEDGQLSYRDRDQHLAVYKRRYVVATLSLRARLWLPGSVELFDEMYAKLQVFLDDLSAAHLSRLPMRLHYLIESVPDNKRQLLSPGWRRLGEIDVIRDGVNRLLAGEDPKAIRASMPGLGLPYAEFRQEQRLVISSSHDAILEFAHQRIVASQRVAAEKYLEGDTIHKPDVEENLFVSARRRGLKLGLSPETAEDIARLLLAKAREVQEQTLNEIAVKLSRLHGEILDAPSPQTRLSEADIAIPSLVVRTGDQPLAREDELIKEFRLTGLNESYSNEREAFIRWFEWPHHYFVKGLIVGSRDNDLFLQALTGKERCKVIASFSPARPMHVGHGALVNLLVYYQELGAEIAISFNDIDVLHQAISTQARGKARKIKAPEDEGLMKALNLVRARTREVMREFLLQFATMGLDLDRVDVYSVLTRQDVLELAFELGSGMLVKDLNSALGLRMNDSATHTFLPLLYVADILHHQTLKYGGRCRTLVLSGLERDVYVRMARSSADQFDFEKPSALYLRMVKGLSKYEDPSARTTIEVMRSSVPQGAVFYGDDAKAVRDKIRKAYTGGRRTQEEQRRLGGNPDPRVCSVSSLLAFHGLPDPAEYEQVRTACLAGSLSCSECKAGTIERMTELLAKQQEQQHTLPPELLARVEELVARCETRG